MATTCQKCGKRSGRGIREVRRRTFVFTPRGSFSTRRLALDLCGACGDPTTPDRHQQLTEWARRQRPNGKRTAGQELRAREQALAKAGGSR